MKVTSGELTENSRLQTQGKYRGTVHKNVSKVLSSLQRLGNVVLRHPAVIASLAVTGLLVGGRKLGLLEPLELSAYDRLVQLRPTLPPDSRLLVVHWTEQDIQRYPYPLPDQLIDELLAKLEQHQPAVIGLDNYRDKATHPDLLARLSKSDRIISVCQLRHGNDPGTPAPPSVSEKNVGFSDVVVDKPSGIVRRGLLYTGPTETPGCTTQLSLSFQLATRYLEKMKGIKPELTEKEDLKLGKTVIKPLSPTSGGYQHGDAEGYQILLNYRSPDALAQSVTLSDVLNNKIDPSWVKDRIVLIGSSASSLKDDFYTPYSSGNGPLQKMPGVEVHGQIVSQILSAVLDGRPIFWFWPDWGEVLWIWGWSLTGGVLVRVIRHPGQLVLAEGTALALLLGTSMVLFLGSGWIPAVAPSLGLIIASTSVLAYTAYDDYTKRRQAEEELKDVRHKAREQEQNIELIQALLREKPNEPAVTPDSEELTDDEETTLAPDEDEESTAVWNPQEQDEESTAIWNPQDNPDDQTTPSNDSAHLLARRYKIIRVLAQGGFGLTYLAEDTHRPGSPECVVKHLRPARRDERFLGVARRLFRTEAEILEKLGKHPQIPQLLAYFEEDQEFYLVQEYIEGHTLSDELPVDKRLPEEKVVKLLKEILDVLIFIHEHGVIHRDIKPSNII
ncbi:MAG: CHASE2 domain-containing serine/threonine-protein kinase, partial [Coleofasciculus sp. S288]|nr:CHASE2 domain-containing serine/threonine-protein kinase [Coleofasciculus sp. S288]